MRSVYTCSVCGRVLQIRRGARTAGGGADQFSGTCADCGSSLERGTEFRLASALSTESNHIMDTRQQESRGHVLFQRASAIPHFCLGFPKLDSLMRPLSIGKLVVLSGVPSSMVVELAAIRAQLPIESGGLDSAVVYIDGGNRSDPYLFSYFAKQKALDPTAAMRRVASCRVFTLYQLASLVSERLPRTTEDYGTKLVIIADVLGSFNEPELEEREARRALAAIEEGIQDVKRHALVIATIPSPNRYDTLVSEWGDTSVRLTSNAGDIRAELVRQRGREPRTATFKQAHFLRAARAGALN